MKKILNLLFSTLFLLFTSCSSSDAQIKNPSFELLLKTMYKNTVPTISVKELDKKLKNFTLLDAREKREFEVSHIEDAKWIGYDTFNKKNVSELDKNEPIVVYCSIGYRSERIGEKLVDMGFKEVYNLKGGIFEWVNQDQTVLDNQAKETDKVHAFSKTWGIWLDKGNKIYK